MTRHQVDVETAISDREILDALPRAIVVTDPVGRILRWNRAAEVLYGWEAHEVIGRDVRDVLVAEQDHAVCDPIMDQVRSGQVWTGDFTVRRSDGEAVRVSVVDRPITLAEGTVVGIVGSAEDVTEQRLMESTAQDLSERLHLALDAGGLGTWRWDMATNRTEWDPRMEALFGLAPGTFDGTFDAWVALLHPDDVAQALAVVDEAVRTRSEYVVQHRAVWPDGSTHWLQGAGGVTTDDSGKVTGTIGCCADVTGRIEAEQERQRLMVAAVAGAEAERVHSERIEFLSQIGEAVNLAADRGQLMKNVVAAAVPRLGDWCAIHVLTDKSAVPDVEIAHADPDMVAYARELQDRFPYDPEAPTGIAAVIRTGQPEFYPDITDQVVDALDPSPEEREILRRLALRSAITVPLQKRGRILGAMQFVMTESSRRYTQEDVALATAVAGRISASLEFRRVSDQQAQIARTLQASLLPAELPSVPGLDIAVRYWAAGDGVEVGGDFYDLFSIEPGRWAVMIGDVCGTGPAAAAVTGLARHTLASAACREDHPERVLRHLNDMMRKRRANTFLTAVYGELRERSHGFELALSSAGHPLPLLARPGQPAEPCAVPGTLLGVFDEISVTTSTRHLQPGDTVVLYTDGATDVPHPFELDPAAMARLVGDASTDASSAEGVADAIHERLGRILPFEQRNDDIALLVLRVVEPDDAPGPVDPAAGTDGVSR